jgi:hypothetical protein
MRGSFRQRNPVGIRSGPAAVIPALSRAASCDTSQGEATVPIHRDGKAVRKSGKPEGGRSGCSELC